MPKLVFCCRRRIKRLRRKYFLVDMKILSMTFRGRKEDGFVIETDSLGMKSELMLIDKKKFLRIIQDEVNISTYRSVIDTIKFRKTDLFVEITPNRLIHNERRKGVFFLAYENEKSYIKAKILA